LELGEGGEDGELLAYQKIQSRVQRYFKKKGASEEDARDLTQDTFLRVFRSEAKLGSRTELEAWIFGIARNVWLNMLRDQAAGKRAGITVSLDELRPGGGTNDFATTTAGEADALESAITREQLETLRNALAELPEQMRQCVYLRLRDDLKYKEIATVMGISIDTVKSHLSQAKKRLRHLLEPHFGPIDRLF
jgi:RNA polymerase sigma-70 factor (ECF subfamily)